MNKLNGILKSFNKTITKLEKLSAANERQAEFEQANARAALDKANSLVAEAESARGIADKIRTLVTV